MYPFSISVDEHIPLNMSARRIFSREGPIVNFPGVGKNIFAGGTNAAKFDFHHSKLRKHLFIKTFDGKVSNFKMLGRSWPSLPTPMPLKLQDKKTGEEQKYTFQYTYNDF